MSSWSTGAAVASDIDAERVAVECLCGLGGDCLGTVHLDPDASIGQFKSRVRKLIANRYGDEEVGSIMSTANFQMEGKCFSFNDDYLKFMLTPTLRGKEPVTATIFVA